MSHIERSFFCVFGRIEWDFFFRPRITPAYGLGKASSQYCTAFSSFYLCCELVVALYTPGSRRWTPVDARGQRGALQGQHALLARNVRVVVVCYTVRVSCTVTPPGTAEEHVHINLCLLHGKPKTAVVHENEFQAQ